MFVCVEVGLVFDYLNVYAVSRHLLVEPGKVVAQDFSSCSAGRSTTPIIDGYFRAGGC